MFDGGEKKWNWQYHCRSAPKGRRSAPPRWSRDVYSGRRRRGRVPLCHRLLCRLTFQLVVIRSSSCLGASFPASVLRKSHENARICRRALLLRRFHGGEEDYPREGKLEEVNYQQIFTVAACSRFSFSFFFTPFCFYTSYMFIPAWNLLVNLFSPTAAAHYTGRAVCARKRRGKGGRIPRRLRYHFLMKYGKRGWSLRDRSKEKLVVRNWEGAALPQQWR